MDKNLLDKPVIHRTVIYMTEQNMATFKAEVERKEGMASEAKMGEFSQIIDEPKHLGGTDKGPNPLVLLLSSLGGCLNIAGNVVAKEMGLELEDLIIKIEGDLDPRGFQGKADVPSGFQEIRVKIENIGGIPEKKMDEFIEEIKDRCPVEDTLERSLEIEIER